MDSILDDGASQDHRFAMIQDSGFRCAPSSLQKQLRASVGSHALYDAGGEERGSRSTSLVWLFMTHFPANCVSARDRVRRPECGRN
jgi:hypothetical protein